MNLVCLSLCLPSESYNSRKYTEIARKLLYDIEIFYRMFSIEVEVCSISSSFTGKTTIIPFQYGLWLIIVCYYVLNGYAISHIMRLTYISEMNYKMIYLVYIIRNVYNSFTGLHEKNSVPL